MERAFEDSDSLRDDVEDCIRACEYIHELSDLLDARKAERRIDYSRVATLATQIILLRSAFIAIGFLGTEALIRAKTISQQEKRDGITDDQIISAIWKCKSLIEQIAENDFSQTKRICEAHDIDLLNDGYIYASLERIINREKIV